MTWTTENALKELDILIKKIDDLSVVIHSEDIVMQNSNNPEIVMQTEPDQDKGHGCEILSDALTKQAVHPGLSCNPLPASVGGNSEPHPEQTQGLDKLLADLASKRG